jgi:hypothetical protein
MQIELHRILQLMAGIRAHQARPKPRQRDRFGGSAADHRQSSDINDYQSQLHTRQNQAARTPSAFVSVSRASIFAYSRGARALVEDFIESECKSDNPRCFTPAKNEALVAASTTCLCRVSEMASAKELLVPGQEAP